MTHDVYQEGDGDTLELRSLVMAALRRWRIILAAVLITPVVLVAPPLLQDRQYQAEVAMVSKQESNMPMALQALQGSGLLGGLGTGASLATHEVLMTDPRLVRDALASIGIEMEEADFRAFLREQISVELPPNSEIVALKIKDTNAGRAADIANAIAETYLGQQATRSRSAAGEAADYIEEQMEQVQRQIVSTEQERQDYKLEQGVTDVQTEVEARTQLLAQLEGDVVTARAAKMAAEQSRAQMRERLSDTADTYVASSIIARNPVIVQLESSLADLMIEYEGAKVTYGAQHEQVQQLESRIAAAKEELAEAVDTHISEEVEAPNPLHQELYRSLAEAEASVLAEGARERALETVAQDLRSRLAMLPIHERELGSIERDFRLLNEVYVELFKSYNETKLMEIMADTDLRVQYPAIPPKQPVSRGLLSKGVIGLVLGFLLGAFIAGLLEVTDRRVKSDEDLVEPLSIPVIARLPWYKDRPAPDEVPSRAAYAEAVRRWRMELLAGGGANDRTVILVGATATEGRSVALATLARQLAHGGVKVVAVDAAAEDPRLHQLMGVEATKGWWDAIAGAGSAVDMCQSTDVPNLHILPAGSEPVDPDGLMATGSADAALHQLREGFDVVLVDASPMSHNGSALLLAQLCDTVFLASRQGHSVRADVVDLAEMLREKGTPARGLVFFGVRKRG